jgi:hypothetical protein
MRFLSIVRSAEGTHAPQGLGECELREIVFLAP